MVSLWSICMSLRLKPSLCLPQGILKSTTGVCWLVFLPSIQTSDQGTELTVMLQSPFGPLSSSALAEAPALSPASSSPTSWVLLCRGTCGEDEGGGATCASCVSAGALGGGLGGAVGDGGGGATATSGCEDV